MIANKCNGFYICLLNKPTTLGVFLFFFFFKDLLIDCYVGSSFLC